MQTFLNFHHLHCISKVSLPLYLYNNHHQWFILHSYDLVCSIRKRIDEAIGPLVESRLEESVVEGDGHNTVPLILEEVLASNE